MLSATETTKTHATDVLRKVILSETVLSAGQLEEEEWEAGHEQIEPPTAIYTQITWNLR